MAADIVDYVDPALAQSAMFGVGNPADAVMTLVADVSGGAGPSAVDVSVTTPASATTAATPIPWGLVLLIAFVVILFLSPDSRS